ncbi:MAG TPA: acyl-CoA dehydrogenase family protein [Dehalococcoidia bacterium]|nr:acyl-CoA dehydrogenase family protein [Dehalococcoidia bacterium]
MEFNDTAEEAAWRKEVRDFLDKEYPDEFRGRARGRGAGGGGGASEEGEGLFRGPNEGDPMKRWRKALSSRGWVAPAWPKEYGGAGLDTKRQFIMNEEFAEFGAMNVGGFGVMMFGPTLIVHGTDEQKKEHLPGILNGEVQWCQGWSEPNAGSDVASVQTRAVRDGDDYVINGQKIWTTGAQFADMMYMLARTDPEAPKHRGISYFMLDMHAPGVTVRPLMTMAGSAVFNEVFFENVRVPARNRLGEENRGWYIGTTTLDFERSSIGSAVGIRKQLEGIMRFAQDHPELSVGARSHATQLALADRWIEALVARMMSYRVVSMQNAGLIPNHEASMCKLFTSEMGQRIAALGMKLTGLYGMVTGGDPKYAAAGRYGVGYVAAVSSTIAGGTSEIQRNIMAQRGLGLPRD